MDVISVSIPIRFNLNKIFGMKKWLLHFGIILTVVLAVYNMWAITDRAREHKAGWTQTPEYKTRFEYIETGIDSGKGNLIGIQPFFTTSNYSTAFNFETTLRFYFEQLKRENKLTEKSVVVLPEYIGTWLVAANEKEKIYQQININDAMTTMVTSNIFKFLFSYFQSPAKDKTKYAIFHMKAKQMAEQYQKIFSSLAKDYNCSIVAGSIALPDASVNKEGNLKIKNGGEIFNTAVVFGNEGKIILPLVKKIFPIDSEQGFTKCGKADQQPIFQTKAGRMAVLICADSWYPEAYATISNKVDFIVVPSLAETDSIWLAPWKGYNGFKAPADVDTTDYKKITEGDAWVKYSMGKRAVQSNIHDGINVFFTGAMWDMKAEGRVLILNHDSLIVLPAAIGKGRIVKLWMR
jgi:predicted amidohydrolase